MKLTEVAYRGPDWKDDPFRRHVLKLEQITKDFISGSPASKLITFNRGRMTNSLTSDGQTWNIGITYDRPGIDDEKFEISSMYKGSDPAILAKLRKHEGTTSAEDRFSKITRSIIGLIDRLKKEDSEILSLTHISFYERAESEENLYTDLMSLSTQNGDYKKFAAHVSKFNDSINLKFKNQADIDKSARYDALIASTEIKEGESTESASPRAASVISSLTSMIWDTTRRHEILKKTRGAFGDHVPDVKVTHTEDSHFLQIEINWPLMKEGDKNIRSMYRGDDELVKTQLFDKLMRERWEKVNTCAVEIVRTIQTNANIKKQLKETEFKLSRVYCDQINRLTRYAPQNFLAEFGKRQPTLDDLDSNQTILILRFDLPDEEK